jgi:hypothetical protein
MSTAAPFSAAKGWKSQNDIRSAGLLICSAYRMPDNNYIFRDICADPAVTDEKKPSRTRRMRD